MAEASYDRQHLAAHAFGFINGDGTTAVAFGCQLTRIGTGHYGLVLGNDDGVVADESFTFVQTKGSAARAPVVDDTSDVLKTIRVFGGGTTALQDTAIEVALYRTVTR